ncbi:terpene synthase family protein [Nocardia sp. NPDC023852]|uniref:terpene synthase family protein n=1 Tax=Nocardia sp. NPDC023852 TaxID=3154697 RepID=UPI0033F6EE97
MWHPAASRPTWTRSTAKQRRWFGACEREAHHRINGYIPATADYLPLRRSTSGIDIALACVEVYQDRELPSKLRNHPVIRRLEELAFLVTFVENDLVSLDRDEADHVPYNLVRAVRHETGCTRREAVEQVQRRLADQRAQLDAVLRYASACSPACRARGKSTRRCTRSSRRGRCG